jgi:hypothetical protein
MMETISSARSPRAASPSMRIRGNRDRAASGSVRFVNRSQASAWSTRTLADGRSAAPDPKIQAPPDRRTD